MEARLRKLTSISVLCILFFLFFPLSKWLLLAAFILGEQALYYCKQKRTLPDLGLFSLLFILSFCVFYPNFIAIILMCLCSFYFHTISIDPGRKLIMAALLFCIHIWNNPHLDLMVVLIAILFFHLVITVIMTSHNRTQLLQRVKILMALGIGGSIAIGIFPYLASGIRSVMGIGIYGLSSLVSGGFHKVFNLGKGDKKEQERNDSLTLSNWEGNTYEYTEYETPSYLYSILIIILLVISIAIISLIVNRRRGKREVDGHKSIKLSRKTSRLLREHEGQRRRVKAAPPPNIPIRKLVYKFEKEMKGMDRRKRGESFHEWLNRIHVYREESNSKLNEIYERARYGEEEIQKNDVKFFADGLKEIKKKLKRN